MAVAYERVVMHSIFGRCVRFGGCPLRGPLGHGPNGSGRDKTLGGLSVW